MNAFMIIASLILYGMTFLCYYIPFKKGQQQTGYLVAVVLGVLITLSLIGNFDYLVGLIWIPIIMFQIIFISYWTFIAFNRKKLGITVATILTFGFLMLIMEPWISDWTFNKKDVVKILDFHNLELKDDFKILKNYAGGINDYYETFTLKLSDKDFNRLSQTIKTSKNYKGLFTDYLSTPEADKKTFETIDFETENHFNRESWSNMKMENGTYHFHIQLDKLNKELSYIGSDE